MNLQLLLLLLFKKRQSITKSSSSCQSFTINSNFYFKFFHYSDYQFFSIFRMNKECFELLLNKLRQFKTINRRSLLIYLYRMAHGNGFRAVGSFFHLSAATCHSEFWNVVEVVVNNKAEFISYPAEDQFEEMANPFYIKSNRYDILGAMDGTFIRISRPTRHCNFYYNRKGFFAIHILAVCDWTFKFWYVQAGQPGNTHDSMAFLDSRLHSDIVSGSFNLRKNDINYKLLTDSAFRQMPFIIKTNSTSTHRQRQFFHEYQSVSNESARTCIECIFGIMIDRWQIFKGRINDHTERVSWLAVSGCCIHNFIQRYNEQH